jgi:hypothetical protein
MVRTFPAKHSAGLFLFYHTTNHLSNRFCRRQPVNNGVFSLSNQRESNSVSPLARNIRRSFAEENQSL